MMSDSFETTSLTELRALVMFHYTDMPLPVLDHYIREAAIRFARQSKLLRRTLTIDAQKGVDHYLLDDLPDGYRLYEISRVRVDGHCIEQVCDECRCSHGKFKFRSNELTVCGFCGRTIEVDCIVLPTRNTCELDADIVDLWGDVIAYGVNSRLMKSNDKRWRNLGVANNEEMLFMRGVEEAQQHSQRNGIVDKVWNVKTSQNNKGNTFDTGGRDSFGSSTDCASCS